MHIMLVKPCLALAAVDDEAPPENRPPDREGSIV